MTTLTGSISSLAAAQFEGFFAALETAPNLSAELNAFADALDLGAYSTPTWTPIPRQSGQ
jgi:hypothetical protein